MIQIEKCTADEINIDKKEVLRYLGYGNHEADSAVEAVIDACMEELMPKLSCRACFDRFPISQGGDGTLDFAFYKAKSQSLSKNLSGCDEIILFTATVGIEVDRIIQRSMAISPLNAVVAQALGSAAIEEWCDILCSRFEERERKNGAFLRPRFSPGYGDFSLEAQKNIFGALDCSRKIGVTLSESLLMMPSKSVSAIVGISRENLHCTPKGCEECKNTECDFRRS